MLTSTHKASILRKTGIAVPTAPYEQRPQEPVDVGGAGGSRPSPADARRKSAFQAWAAAVDVLYVTFAAARAAKNLRDAEEVRQLDMLRRMSATNRSSGIHEQRG